MCIKTFLHASNHNIDDINIPIMQQGTSSAKIDFNNKIYSIVIKDDVWIGSKCILLSGTYLEKGFLQTFSLTNQKFPKSKKILSERVGYIQIKLINTDSFVILL